MNNQLIGRIHDRMSGFSKGQKRIAKYIEEHYDKVAFMTASKLGATVGVSESTVVRFATEIGYSGYPELQRAMQEMIRSRLTSVQRLEITAQNLEIPQLLSAVLNQDIDIIRRTNEETSHEDFYQAVDAIVDARRVYIMGARSSHALATFLSYYFNLIFDSVRLVNCSSEAEILNRWSMWERMTRWLPLASPLFQKSGQGPSVCHRPGRQNHCPHGQSLVSSGRSGRLSDVGSQ